VAVHVERAHVHREVGGVGGEDRDRTLGELQPAYLVAAVVLIRGVGVVAQDGCAGEGEGREEQHADLGT
jgi:hypothetical protein